MQSSSLPNTISGLSQMTDILLSENHLNKITEISQNQDLMWYDRKKAIKILGTNLLERERDTLSKLSKKVDLLPQFNKNVLSSLENILSDEDHWINRLEAVSALGRNLYYNDYRLVHIESILKSIRDENTSVNLLAQCWLENYELEKLKCECEENEDNPFGQSWDPENLEESVEAVVVDITEKRDVYIGMTPMQTTQLQISHGSCIGFSHQDKDIQAIVLSGGCSGCGITLSRRLAEFLDAEIGDTIQLRSEN